jgi:hypothetical protein
LNGCEGPSVPVTLEIYALPTVGSINTTNETCVGYNDGTASVVIATTPSGTVSTLSYCSSGPNTGVFASTPAAIIENVTLNGQTNNINNNTAGVPDLYQDYTASMYADITEGQSYTVDVTLNGLGAIGTSTNYSGGKVYIDYNIDGVFDPITELVGTVPYRDATTIGLAAAITFTVPTTGAYGPTRMRVVSQFIGGTPNPNSSTIGPCDDAGSGFGTPWHGATEDYSIVLNVPATYQWFNSSGIMPGETNSSISGLAPGSYSVDITDYNGCITNFNPVVISPATPITVTAGANQIICDGETPSSLSASSGGGVTGTYSWADASNPLVVLGTGSTFSPPALTTTTVLQKVLVELLVPLLLM